MSDETRERRKFGTDQPHEPTDEFIVQAFAEGARYLWPDSRDPGWHVTFRRWLAEHDARVRAEERERTAQAIEDCTADPDGGERWHLSGDDAARIAREGGAHG